MRSLVRLLAGDVVLEMPPVPPWYRGKRHYGRFLERVFGMRGTGWAMRELTAKGQPALAAYAPQPGGGHRLHTLPVFTVSGGQVAHNVVFADPRVFGAFGLPRESPERGQRPARVRRTGPGSRPSGRGTPCDVALRRGGGVPSPTAHGFRPV